MNSTTELPMSTPTVHVWWSESADAVMFWRTPYADFINLILYDVVQYYTCWNVNIYSSYYITEIKDYWRKHTRVRLCILINAINREKVCLSIGLFTVLIRAHSVQIVMCDVGPCMKSLLSFEAKQTNKLKTKDHKPRTYDFSKDPQKGKVGNFSTQSSA